MKNVHSAPWLIVGLLLLMVNVPTMAAQTYYRITKTITHTNPTDDDFGISMAAENDILFIGAAHDREIGAFSGAIYIFERNSTGVWEQVQKLVNPNMRPSDDFGSPILLQGDMAIIGARSTTLETASGSHQYQGTVYVYQRQPSGEWVLKQQITGQDSNEGDFFGWPLVRHGDTLLIGATSADETEDYIIGPGAVYVFKLINGEWQQIQKLVSPHAERNFKFGSGMAWQEDTLLITATNYDAGNDGTAEGAVYVYRQDSSGFFYLQSDFSPNQSDLPQGDPYIGFGSTDVAFDANLAIFSAASMEVQGVYSAGALFCFRQDGAGSWQQFKKMVSPVPQKGGNFGVGFLYGNSRLFVGERYGLASYANTGAIYIYGPPPDFDLLQILTAPTIDGNGGALLAFNMYLMANGNLLIAGKRYNPKREVFSFYDSVVYIAEPVSEPAVSLEASLTASKEELQAGEIISYTVQVRNTGTTVTATDVALSSVVPREAELVEIDSTCQVDAWKISCPLADLPPGNMAEMSFIMQLNENGSLYNFLVASANAAQPDAEMINNHASARIKVHLKPQPNPNPQPQPEPQPGNQSGGGASSLLLSGFLFLLIFLLRQRQIMSLHFKKGDV